MFNDLIKEELFADMIDEDYIEHYGMPRRSGRFPWGSGENPYQHVGDFSNHVKKLRDQGISDTEIAKMLHLTSASSLKERYRQDNNEARRIATDAVISWEKDGLTREEMVKKLAEQYNYHVAGESTIRSMLNEERAAKRKVATKTADFLKEQVKNYGYIDVGSGANSYVKIGEQIGVSETKLKEALTMLQDEGYKVYDRAIPTVTNKQHHVNMKILCPPGTAKADILPKKNEDGQIESDITIHSLTDYISPDNGETFNPKFKYPSSMDPKRLQVVYAEDGGKKKDGLIELRRGVDDLSLGASNYSQVRIMVNGTHYLKGMAVYADDLPAGVDVRFNTNKTKDYPILGEDKDHTVLKPIKKDPDNPFGALLKEEGGQSYYIGEDGKKHLSLINKTREENDWSDWKDRVPAQFLSKQDLPLIKQQLHTSLERKENNLKEIEELTNPTLKKKMLLDFADDCDQTAIDLSASALPGQKYHVILPLTDIKETEAYARQYANGTKLALIRYPHAGTFEIPIVTVNNNIISGQKMIANSSDAIGINSEVAERLSGADFDGDTVMAIPITDKIRITSTPRLEGLIGFDPSMEYPKRDGMKRMTKELTQREMGIISNLITDMTIQGASTEELTRAVKHSMVVIDAEKHAYDYKKSEEENGIEALKRIYQKKPDGGYGGAATIISKAKSEDRVTKTQGTPKINVPGKDWYDPTRPEGALVYSKVSDEDKRYKNYILKDERERLEKMGFSEQEIKDIVKAGQLPDGSPVDIKKKDQWQYKSISDSQWKKLEDSGYTKQQIYKIIEDEKLPDGTPINVKVNYRTEKATKMETTDDAYSLVSESRKDKELVYAEYANRLKAMANKARLEYATTSDIPYSPSAKAAYAPQVASLKAQLNNALKNSPRERAANTLAYNRLSAKKLENPGMSQKDEKKEAQRLIQEARLIYDAKKEKINVSDDEWKAIQAGAIPPTTLSKILDNANMSTIIPKAMPHQGQTIPLSTQRRIQALSAKGYGPAQIAEQVGASVSTVARYMKEEKQAAQKELAKGGNE